jgi:cell wall-associated NlpC family hydrolase
MVRSLFASTPSRIAAALVTTQLLAGCGSTPQRPAPPQPLIAPPPVSNSAARHWFALHEPDHVQQIVLYALGLLDTGYRFGGSNPAAGLDCSGMVSYIVEQVSGQKLPHNAAQIAERTRPIAMDALRPGDLVFFNTLGRAHSHMGIYLGDGRFIHAPNSRGRVRTDRLDNRYYAERFEGGRTLLPPG